MRVVFVQKFVPHYRLPFFEALRARLADKGIDFQLIYGQPDPFEGSKVKMEHPSWGNKVVSKIPKVAGRYLYWLGAIKYLKKNDMVVVEHAAKLLDNYIIYLASRVGYLKMGYFGHGENFQSRHELAVSRIVKESMLKKVTRWFAYTEVSRQSLLRQGVDDQKISVVNNTLKAPENDYSSVEKVAGKFVYIGGLYEDKRFDILLAAAEMVANEIPEFILHVMGAGPMRGEIEEAAKEHNWLVYHGSMYGEERNQMLASSVGMLMPGLVGLVAIDSFFFRCPILTSDAGQHSPEIAYLEHDLNALVAPNERMPDTYAQMVLRFIQEPGLSDRLQEACANSAGEYTIENMALRFCEGVEQCWVTDS